ncbi:MAG: radical SAM protein, partial [Candidatus Omnitrophota bacterium]
MDNLEVDKTKKQYMRHDKSVHRITWQGIIPSLGQHDKAFVQSLLRSPIEKIVDMIGNQERFGVAEKKQVCKSPRVFKKAFKNITNEVLDRWMNMLSQASLEDIADFHIPFVRNVNGIRFANELYDINFLIKKYIGLCKQQETKQSKSNNSLPSDVIIEISQSCNFSCIMCVNSKKSYTKKQLPITSFEKIIKLFGQNLKKVRISGLGESTIVSNFSDYIHCLDTLNHNFQKEIITNYSAPAEVYVDLLRKDYTIIVSWDASTKDLFQKIRRGSNFNYMLKSLRLLSSECSNYSKNVILMPTIQKINMHEIIPLINFAAHYGIKYIAYNMVQVANNMVQGEWLNRNNATLSDLFEKALSLSHTLGISIAIPDHIGKYPLHLQGTRKSAGT